MDRDQWVPIQIVAGFNQVRKMTNRLELVVSVLRGEEQAWLSDSTENTCFLKLNRWVSLNQVHRGKPGFCKKAKIDRF